MCYCPHCDSPLETKSAYGRKGEPATGIIYKCPNAEGFETEEEAREYETLFNGGPSEDWQDIACDSANSHVIGSFYTDKHGAMHEGYPC